MRIALGLEYDGRAFSGWQSQPTGAACRTRSSARSSAIADAPVAHDRGGPHRRRRARDAAGRAFRHRRARGRTPPGCAASTRICRPTVAVLWAQPVRRRFPCALRRAPRGTTPICCSIARGAPGAARRPRRLVPSAARRRGDARGRRARCVGTHDFSRVPRRRVPGEVAGEDARRALDDRARRRHASASISRANAFLHHMVRNIVGALVYVGAGKAAAGVDRASCSPARDRTRAAPTFAADGLYLTGVDYDAQWDLPPTRAAGALPRSLSDATAHAHARQDLRHHARRRRARGGARGRRRDRPRLLAGHAALRRASSRRARSPPRCRRS